MKRAKKVFAVVVVAACLSFSTAGTLAYFIAEEKAHNVITSGNVSIELQELRQNADGSFSEFTDVIGVMPDTSVSKIVQVENDGFGDAFVRVKVEKAIELANGDSGDTSYIGLNFPVGEDADWICRADETGEEWWYYMAPNGSGVLGALAPNVGDSGVGVTSPLFTEVLFDAEMPNEYQNSEATITVTVQAVQSIHNGASALEAAGWPIESAE